MASNISITSKTKESSTEVTRVIRREGVALEPSGRVSLEFTWYGTNIPYRTNTSNKDPIVHHFHVPRMSISCHYSTHREFPAEIQTHRIHGINSTLYTITTRHIQLREPCTPF
nr:PREDICTED: uncharacterized protein LOC105664343 [Megachile rotundata]